VIENPVSVLPALSSPPPGGDLVVRKTLRLVSVDPDAGIASK